MANDYSANVPIYLQIINEIKLKIASGEWKTGQRILPVRELAMQFTVNPNTMQRALAELEREGLIYTERTTGKFVTSDDILVSNVRDMLAREYMQSFFSSMQKLGYNMGQTMKIIEDYVTKYKEGK
ncbi:MAG TPA: GntR family transcriptional regulator [Clostridiaceae bacterium]|nr:GntR family transcriptional regulator [Clostridiaceae bacterium]